MKPPQPQTGTETPLWAFFSDWPDPRVTGRTAHDLFDIVALALCAVMAELKGGTTLKPGGANGKVGSATI
jgi:hypothetical protein